MRWMLWVISVLLGTSGSAQQIKKVEVAVTSTLAAPHELAWLPQSLTWSDFNGIPEDESDYVAMTYSGIRIKYEYHIRSGVPSARVWICPYMDRNMSWVRLEHGHPHILEHEQRHFDITALVAEELAEAVRAGTFQIQNFAQAVTQLHELYLKKLRLRQQTYDRDTHHGQHPIRQQAWNRHLREQCTRLEFQSGCSG